jgi:hypothetical protein
LIATGIETTTFRLVTWRINQLRYRMSLKMNTNGKLRLSEIPYWKSSNSQSIGQLCGCMKKALFKYLFASKGQETLGK